MHLIKLIKYSTIEMMVIIMGITEWLLKTGHFWRLFGHHSCHGVYLFCKYNFNHNTLIRSNLDLCCVYISSIIITIIST